MKKYIKTVIVMFTLILTLAVGCRRIDETLPDEEHVMEAYNMALKDLKNWEWGKGKFSIYKTNGEFDRIWVNKEEVKRWWCYSRSSSSTEKYYRDGYIFTKDPKSGLKTKETDKEPLNAEICEQERMHYLKSVVEILESNMEREVSQLNRTGQKNRTYPDYVILRFDRAELDKRGYEDVGEIIKLGTYREQCCESFSFEFEENGLEISLSIIDDDAWKSYFPDNFDEYEYIE